MRKKNIFIMISNIAVVSVASVVTIYRVAATVFYQKISLCQNNKIITK